LARDRRRATAGSVTALPSGLAADRREGLAEAARSLGDPNVIELLQRFHQRPVELYRRLARSARPGEDVDVLLVEHRTEESAVGRIPGVRMRVEERADQQVGLARAAMMR